MKKKYLDVVIKRSEWLRGRGKGYLWQYRTKCGCCLGHVGLAVGIKKSHLNAMALPADVSCEADREAFAVVGLTEKHEGNHYFPYYTNTDVVYILAEINDDEELSDRQREAAIRKRGLEAGIRFKFVD